MIKKTSVMLLRTQTKGNRINKNNNELHTRFYHEFSR